MKPRIYVDASVIGGCRDDEFSEHSIRLMECFARGDFVIYGYNSVNLRRGCPTIEIRAPREVLSDE